MPDKQSQIEGYVEELRQAEQLKDSARAKEIKAELRRLGHEAQPPAAKAEKRPARNKVFPELRDKEWRKGEADATGRLEEADLEEKTSKGGTKTVRERGNKSAPKRTRKAQAKK